MTPPPTPSGALLACAALLERWNAGNPAMDDLLTWHAAETRATVARALRSLDAANARIAEDSAKIEYWLSRTKEAEFRAEAAEAERDQAREELAAVLSDWNALVKATGSPTNGGAVGHAAALVRERDQARRDAERLDWLHDNSACEVSMCDEGDGDWSWCVHQVTGSRNDREWNLVGHGRTPREALDAAIDALRAVATGEAK